MTYPDRIREWVNRNFAAHLVDQVTQDLIDVAAGNRPGNYFEKEALRKALPDLKAESEIEGNARFVALKDACTTLGIKTLETRGSDHLDFHDISVWKLKAAIESAYEAGLQAGQQMRREDSTT